MREILFRGKTSGNEWVYGNLSVIGDVCFISADMGFNKTVIPKTIGQYAGLTDKNGKKIFEGDIVRIDGKNYEVKYMLGQFFIGINMPIAYKRFECEIVGNIHDNPELLKGD